MDALYNFINNKNTNFLGKNNKLSVGLFGVKHPTQKSLALMEKIISI
ncbi:site-specific DNA-methyltransferase, partial [Helicobacter pylori]|nr:site-specific DNA-methyltransferase [Helicobacter pylori]